MRLNNESGDSIVYLGLVGNCLMLCVQESMGKVVLTMWILVIRNVHL